MRRILDHTTRQAVVHTDDQGDVTQEHVATVTFIDHDGAAHTLIFEPAGTNVEPDPQKPPRVVGQDVPHYAFTSPDEAVDAYENGKVT